MKKIFSISLLLIFLFNLGGYYILFGVLRIHANMELSSKLDDGDYDENEAIQIKIFLSLPYPLQSNDFERQKGQFVHNGEYYQMVKQKYENDTLTVVCIKDQQSRHFSNVLDVFNKNSSRSHQEDSPLNVPSKTCQEYVGSLFFGLVNSNCWSFLIPLPRFSDNCLVMEKSVPYPPPWMSS